MSIDLTALAEALKALGVVGHDAAAGTPIVAVPAVDPDFAALMAASAKADTRTRCPRCGRSLSEAGLAKHNVVRPFGAEWVTAAQAKAYGKVATATALDCTEAAFEAAGVTRYADR